MAVYVAPMAVGRTFLGREKIGFYRISSQKSEKISKKINFHKLF